MNITGSVGGVVDVTALALATAVIVQLTKFLLGYFVKPTSPNQQNITRLYVIAVASVVCGFSIVLPPINTVNDALAAIKTCVGFGFPVAAIAITAYHLLSSDQVPVLGVAAPTSKP